MVEQLNWKNFVKCPHCGALLRYEDEDVSVKEKSYGVGTYNGETYLAHEITCPNCNNTIEVY